MDDAQMIFESCYQFTLTIAFITRILSQLWNHDKLLRLYEAIDHHWNIFTSDIEVRILKDYSLMSRKFTIVYSTLMYSMSSFFIIIPLTPAFLDIILPLNESRPRIFVVEVEFGVDKNQYFVPIFIYITAVIIVGVSIMVGVDTMHIMCTAHACSLFSVVGQQIENILKMDDSKGIDKCGLNTKVESSREEMLYRKYIVCLKKHQLAIE
ncbi:uncharacterized protein LOC116846029 [Odontomachus brunneus]|uniref:uncharacterized protein LOC116846029 n=1 Tax=Odontomachus brunneus TaxID=486640 RepID=UPI0013F19F23|nr:uncharacterized protein LOC116846029 [Odontomachus brunneus]